MLILDREFAIDAADIRGDGFLHVKFVLTEPGVFTYVRDGKTVRALKAPEDWTGDSFLQSARSVPLTLEHPARLVTPSTAFDIMGTADSTPAFAKDGRVFHGGTVQRQEAIDPVRARRIQAVSAGTHVEWVANSGSFLAADGTRHEYDVIQKSPRLNHIALTENPRLKNARILSLDSDGPAIWVPDSDVTMDELQKLLTKLSLDSGTVDALKALVTDRDARITELKSERDTLRGERDAFKAKFESAPSLDSLNTRLLDEVKSLANLASKVPGLSLDALAGCATSRERYLLALDALKVSVSKDESEDYLRARFDAALITKVDPQSMRSTILAHDGQGEPTPAQRIAKIQELDRRRSRGEKV